MPKSPAHIGTDGAWGEVLAEVRELRSRQDARLASAQHQSQLIVAGLLAITAIFVTGASAVSALRPQNTAMPTEAHVLVPAAAAVFAAVVLINSTVWVSTHAATRGWREIADFPVLKSYAGSVEAPSRAQRHLASTLLAHFDHNEAIVQRIQRRVGIQAALTLVFVCSIPLLAAFVWLLR